MVIFFLFFSVSKPIPVKQPPAVPWLITPSDVQILLGSWASMPSLFAISAAHSMLVRGFPFIFTNASLAFWRLFSWKPRVQAPDSQRLAALLNALFISLSLSPSFPLCFFQRKDILVQLKKLQAENALRVWAVSPWCCSYPEHYYPLNHLSLSGQWSVLIFLGEATKQLWYNLMPCWWRCTVSSDSHMDVCPRGWPSMQNRAVLLPRKAAELPSCGILGKWSTSPLL